MNQVDSISILAMRDTGPAPEAAITRDLVKHGLIAAPVLIGGSAAIWGSDGALSCGYGVLIVLANFTIAALLVTRAARISYALMMAATLFGYIFRLALVSAAIFFVRNLSWVELLPLGLTIIISHIGLLFWELRYVSLTLAFPGLKPKLKNSQSTFSTSDESTVKS